MTSVVPTENETYHTITLEEGFRAQPQNVSMGNERSTGSDGSSSSQASQR